MLTQAIQRIDHVGIIVYPENVDKYVKKLSQLLDITFDEPIRNEDAGVIAVLSWDSGLEIMAPLRKEGRYWERLQRSGEGSTVLIFGVKDIDAAMRRAKEQGVDVDFEVKLNGDEPWLSRFKHFREARLEAFEPQFATALTLSQIEPR
jgi:hypothetical protein